MGLQVHSLLLTLLKLIAAPQLLQDAGANGFVASLKNNAATKMGILHAVYGWDFTECLNYGTRADPQPNPVRLWCSLRTLIRDFIRATGTMVFPVSHFPRHIIVKHSPSYHSFPLQDTRRCVPRISTHCFVLKNLGVKNALLKSAKYLSTETPARRTANIVKYLGSEKSTCWRSSS